MADIEHAAQSSPSQRTSTAVLRAAGIDLDDGLNSQELTSIQARFGFEFGSDHREFLQRHLPVGDGWPDWRRGPWSRIEKLLAWPVQGALFDVENRVFWPPRWGPRPVTASDALALAHRHLAAAPVLLPVHRHRYVPAAPAPASAPVFSVHRTDVIYYGDDLANYLEHEFGGMTGWTPRPIVRIPFWSDLAEGLDG